MGRGGAGSERDQSGQINCADSVAGRLWLYYVLTLSQWLGLILHSALHIVEALVPCKIFNITNNLQKKMKLKLKLKTPSEMGRLHYSVGVSSACSCSTRWTRYCILKIINKIKLN
jgi:hypothetical protein